MRASRLGLRMETALMSTTGALRRLLYTRFFFVMRLYAAATIADINAATKSEAMIIKNHSILSISLLYQAQPHNR